MIIQINILVLIILAIFFMPLFSYAGNSSVTNTVSVSASSGGNSSNGADGEAGQNGSNGTTIITGSESTNISVKTVINGEVIENINISDSQEYSSTYESEDGNVKVDTNINSTSGDGGVSSDVLVPEIVKETADEVEEEVSKSGGELLVTNVQKFVTRIISYVFNLFS